MILRYILAWFPMILIAIANGLIRETSYGKHLDELRSHQVSTVTGIILFGLYIWIVSSFWTLESSEQAIIIGLIWFGLTVIFEFSFGRLVAKYSWRKLLSDYNIFAGRVWLLVLLWIAIAPLVFYHFSL